MIKTSIKDIPIEFETCDKVFSPKSVDQGTLCLLSHVEFTPGDYILDLGCGYGVVGILASKIIGPDNVVMTDIQEEAVGLSKVNACLNGEPGINIYQSDGFKNIKESGFSKIISNPPYHSDFSVAKHFIQKGFNRLKIGGMLYLVTKRELWYKKKLISVFGGVTIHHSSGYFVFMAEKRSYSYSKKKKIV